jgi:hypothetical protein
MTELFLELELEVEVAIASDDFCRPYVFGGILPILLLVDTKEGEYRFGGKESGLWVKSSQVSRVT